MFSRFFIDRPIFSIVIAVVMVMVGILTVKTLPVAQYPDITPPTVNVSASYPGADAATVASTIGVPIEEQVNGVEGMMYMNSSSGSDGSYNLTITFETGTDIDNAAVKVQNKVSAAEATLPASVKQQGIQVTTRSTNIIMFVALEADSAHRSDYDALYLTNYAQLNVVDELARLDGVGQVGAFGAGQYSMRVWLDPEKMRVRGLTPDDVIEVIESQNMQVSAGAVGTAPLSGSEAFQFTLTSKGRLDNPEEFANIIIRSSENGEILRLSDIARVDLGSVSYSNTSSVSGNQAGLLGIYQLPGANAIDVAKRVQDKLDDLQQYFPEGVTYRVLMNSTDFVSASIDEVLVTFAETSLIVMIVILIFLQNWRATIIPMLTIPVSLIATFAVMKLLGFTINTLTLFGLVLAIAIVVDDAIVVVEDCARLLDQGKLTSRQAAEKAMKELTGPIIGEVLVLLAVFIPTAFVSGITGELYKQFALTIAVSTAFSGFNALTFTPAMCALFLRPRRPSRFFIFRWFSRGFGAATNGYMKAVTTLLKRPVVAIAIYFVICAAAFYGFVKMPASYIPAEDMGYFMMSAQLPSGASLERTDSVMKTIQARIDSIPEVTNTISITGISFMGGANGSNTGSFFVMLKPWKERKGKDQSVDAVIERVYGLTDDIQEAVIYAVNPPSIPGLGMTAGLQMQLLDINNHGSEAMKEALAQITETASRDKRIQKVQSLYQGTVPQYSLKIDRDKARMLGLHLTDIYSALTSYMGGGSYVNDFNTFGRVYEVLIAADAGSTGQIDDVMKLSVRNDKGDMVPFAAFAKAVPAMGEPSVDRYNMYQTASLTAIAAHGVSSGTAIKAMEEIVKDAVGQEYSYAWTGEAYQEAGGGVTISAVMIFAVIVTLLVLAAQYESLTDPIAVIIATPTAILGTVIGCLFMSQSIDIYTQIGIILLLGLSAKNAILIVEYARDYRAQGQDIRTAAADAGRVRFRPIMMTALAFVFGVMPMLFATGAGAASRIALASAVVFGMAVNAIIGTLFVPGFWELLERFREKHLAGLFSGGGSTTPAPPSGSTDGSREPADTGNQAD